MLNEVVISGNAYERGYQHGEQIKISINEFLEDNLARINLVRSIPIEKKVAMQEIVPYIEIIEQDIPDIAAEIKGFSEGASITYEDAMLLQLRREIIGFSAECSSIGYFDRDEGTVIAQNVDLPGNLIDQGIILRIIPEDKDGIGILQYTQGGLLGYLGMNSRGIAIGINMVLANGWRAGVPIYLLVRHLLQQSNLQACLDEINRIRRASSRSLTLTDGKKIINVEMTVDQIRVREEEIVMHTNHYLHEDFKKLDRISESACSFKRLNVLREYSEDLNGATNLGAIKELLTSHEHYPTSICAHSDDMKIPVTIASVIMCPTRGKMLVSKGNPCVAPYYNYGF